MSYDANGFNYQGISVRSLYDTSIQNQYNFSAYDSGFKIQGTDISKLITPALTNGGTAQRSTKTGSAYTGFPHLSGITFDRAFTKLNPSLQPTVSSDVKAHKSWTTTDGWTCYLWNMGSTTIDFSYPTLLISAYEYGSAVYNNQITSQKMVYMVVVGGGGGGGSGGTALGVNLHSGGPGGPGGGCVVTGRYYMNSNISIKITPGRGGAAGTNTSGNLSGYNGGTSRVYDNYYNNSLDVYGGEGGVFAESQTANGGNPGGSTSGGHAWSMHINSSQSSNGLSGNGYYSNFDSATSGHNKFHIDNVKRNRGGSDTGYGFGGGGGGGAGGVGGNHSGSENSRGGAAGAPYLAWGEYWGGGGPGGGEYSGNPDAVTGATTYNSGNPGFGCGGTSYTRGYGSDGSNGGVCIITRSYDFSIDLT